MNNTTYPSHDAPLSQAESVGYDPLDEITGVVWGSIVGGAFWLLVLALAMFG